ncbi:MAG: ankyrin repeat domain-containing protein [Nocardioidaceae bacterium]|nr:ankyrin repeat domain-containing protein [Nocardioidaceae bacterium]
MGGVCDPAVYLKAAESGDLDAVTAELAAGVPIDSVTRQGRTAVLLAAMNGHLDVVRHLAEAGADLDLQDETSLNPFLHGCLTGDLSLVRLMVESGADLTRLTRFGGNGLTPAAEKGFADVVEYLLTATDINVNHTNAVGWTALIEAIILGDGGPVRQRVVRLLLEHGADPGMTDKWGTKPLDLALEKGFHEIAELLR